MIESPVTPQTNIKQPAWFSLLRMLLGLILFWKGIVFIRDTELLKLLVQHTGVGAFSQNSEWITFIVAYLTLLCGLFIFSGLFTRASCIVQLPIILVAIFFVNIQRVDQSTFELLLSVIVLILLVLFAIIGSGTLSADEFFRTYYKAGSEEGNTERFFKKL
ncbi:MAG TPA: DoxX family protein [Hanamia sp.]|nr:DoxX family protein [Hanamia sp.]